MAVIFYISSASLVIAFRHSTLPYVIDFRQGSKCALDVQKNISNKVVRILFLAITVTELTVFTNDPTCVSQVLRSSRRNR